MGIVTRSVEKADCEWLQYDYGPALMMRDRPVGFQNLACRIELRGSQAWAVGVIVLHVFATAYLIIVRLGG